VIYGCKGKENLFSLYILMLLFAAFFWKIRYDMYFIGVLLFV